ncbi:MAG TPA: hypothetical protein PLB52_04280 [Candidatus Moranbacteria bacterium]|nr:hypothetical protein [Candidatus Moranbacteria bacterium]
MNKGQQKPEAYLAVVFNGNTGLYHGAIYRNHPTPSGFDRFMLSMTTKNGWFSQRKAAEKINIFGAQLGIEQLNPEEFEDAPPLPDLSTLSKKTVLTLITPHEKKEEEYVIAELKGVPISIDILPVHLKRLLACGKIELDSSSGYDKNLNATYEHYVFT